MPETPNEQEQYTQTILSDPLSVPTWPLASELTPKWTDNPKKLSENPKVAQCQKAIYECAGINIDTDRNSWPMKLLKGFIDGAIISKWEIIMWLVNMTREQIAKIIQSIISQFPEIVKAALIDAAQSLQQLLALDAYKAWWAMASFIPTSKILAFAPIVLKTTGRGIVKETVQATLKEMKVFFNGTMDEGQRIAKIQEMLWKPEWRARLRTFSTSWYIGGIEKGGEAEKRIAKLVTMSEHELKAHINTFPGRIAQKWWSISASELVAEQREAQKLLSKLTPEERKYTIASNNGWTSEHTVSALH